MHNNSKIKSLCLALLIALFAVCSVLGLAFAFQTVSAEKYELVVSSEVKNMYHVDDVLNIPSATFKDGDIEYPASTTVIYPNGNEVITEKIIFDTLGAYTIKYTADIGGKVVEDITNTFKVVDKLYTFNSPSCSAEITTYTFTEYHKNFLDDDHDAEGLYVELPEGSTFTYNKTIDVSDNTNKDEIISFNIISTEFGRADFTMFTVRLVDIYDETNYITYEFFESGCTNSFVYVRGSASNQGSCNSYAMGEKNKYGSLVYCSKNNKSYQDQYLSVKDNTFKIGIDYETKKLFACRHLISSGLDNMMEFCDLTSTALFSETWDGFTTGEVKLVLYPSYFTAKDTTGSGMCQLLIREVDGQPISKSVDGEYSGTENYYVEKNAPKIDIDLGEYTLDTLPLAVVGNSYNVFPATAVDAESAIKEFTTKVFFHYYDNPIKIDIVDGKFTPNANQPGLYTIEYRAVDYFGNESVKLVDVQCSAGANYEIQLADDGSANPMTGHAVKVKTPSVVNASGVASVAVSAVDEKGNTYSIPTNTLQFVPLAGGEITVTYIATDYVGRKVSKDYVITVEVDAKPVFLNEASFFKYFVQGNEYSIPELSAMDFVADKIITPKFKYKIDDGEWTEYNDSTLKLDEDKELKDYTLYVKYTAESIGDKNNFATLEYSIPCININKKIVEGEGEEEIVTIYKDRSKLFVIGENVTNSFAPLEADADTEYATYTFTADDYMEYINPLTAIDFSTLFAFTNGSVNSLVFTFTDVENPDVVVTLTLSSAGSSTSVQTSGGLLFLIKTMNFKRMGYAYNVVYDAANLAFKVADSGDSFVVKTTVDGKAFTGFPSQKFYLRIDVNGVTEGAKIAVTEINKNYLIDTRVDRQGATAKTLTVYDQNFYTNTEYVFSKTVILDFVRPDIKATITIKSPTGQIVKDVNGFAINNAPIDQDYTIVFTSYGNYSVIYNISGQSTIKKNVKVIDTQAPVLQIEEIASRYRVGKSVMIKGVAEDDSGSQTTIYVSVFDASRKYTTLTNGEEYKFEKAGNYTFVFIAYDEAGNASVIRKYVTVK